MTNTTNGMRDWADLIDATLRMNPDYELDGLVRRDEITQGDLYLSSHYGIVEAVNVQVGGCHGETTEFRAKRPGGTYHVNGLHAIIERYDSVLLIPRLRRIGTGRGIHPTALVPRMEYREGTDAWYVIDAELESGPYYTHHAANLARRDREALLTNREFRAEKEEAR